MKESLLFTALSLGAVFGGYFVGASIRYPGTPPHYGTLLAELAAMLGAIGYCIAKISPRLYATRCSTVSGASICYSAALALGDPVLHFTEPGTSSAIVITACLLPIPLVFTVGAMLHYREYFALVGVTLFVFACYALLGGNMNVRDAGVGFYTYWWS
jgi:hypothetical protein